MNERSYWNSNGEAQALYDEMQAAAFKYTKATEALFRSYHRYYNDGDLPGWARRRPDAMARHDEAMCRIKHHRDLPQKSPGACLRMTRDARLRCTHRLPAAVFRLATMFLCCARPLSFPGSLWVATSRIE